MRYTLIAVAGGIIAALPLLQALGRHLAKQTVSTRYKVEKTDAKDTSGVSKDPRS